MPLGQIGEFYEVTLTPSSGAAPYTFEITGGSVPAGLVLDADTGVLSGIPTSGSGVFTVTVTDANDCTGIHEYMITLADRVVEQYRTTLPPSAAGTEWELME